MKKEKETMITQKNNYFVMQYQLDMFKRPISYGQY